MSEKKASVLSIGVPDEHSGEVVKLFPKEGYGFLEDKTVGEIYFHANSVPNDGFRKLKLGAGEAENKDGPFSLRMDIGESYHPPP